MGHLADRWVDVRYQGDRKPPTRRSTASLCRRRRRSLLYGDCCGTFSVNGADISAIIDWGDALFQRLRIASRACYVTDPGALAGLAGERGGCLQSRWFTTLMTLPSGARTKNRRTPHGS
jgi:hypothetical protein